jgi:hypothetical protein
VHVMVDINQETIQLEIQVAQRDINGTVIEFRGELGETFTTEWYTASQQMLVIQPSNSALGMFCS